MAMAITDKGPDQGLASGRHRFTPQAVARMLGQIEARAVAAGDTTVIGVVEIARRALAEWQGPADRLGELEQEYQRLAELETNARERLRDILDLVDKLASQPTFGSAPPDAGRSAPGVLALTPRPRLRDGIVGMAVRLLGSFNLTVEGRQVTGWHGYRARALLQFLAAHRHRVVSREDLIGAVWPDVEDDSGRHRLHQGIYELRSTLRTADPNHSHVICAGGRYGFDHSLPVWVDVEEFDALASAAQRSADADRVDEAVGLARDALALYRGDFLSEFIDIDWTTTERNRLRARFVLLSVRQAELLTHLGDDAAALAVIDPVLDLEPWNEDATVLKMRCHTRAGARSMAAVAYRSCADALSRELGIAPGAHTMRAYEQLQRDRSS
jgi:DNA-binding SARP family transcriptional activator